MSVQTAILFVVSLWKPIWNHTESNLGSREDVTVSSRDRLSAIIQAFSQRYYPHFVFLPEDKIVKLEPCGKFFVAFRPKGRAVGDAYLVQAKNKSQVWHELPNYLGGKRPAWVEPITVRRQH